MLQGGAWLAAAGVSAGLLRWGLAARKLAWSQYVPGAASARRASVALRGAGLVTGELAAVPVGWPPGAARRAW